MGHPAGQGPTSNSSALGHWAGHSSPSLSLLIWKVGTAPVEPSDPQQTLAAAVTRLRGAEKYGQPGQGLGTFPGSTCRHTLSPVPGRPPFPALSFSPPGTPPPGEDAAAESVSAMSGPHLGLEGDPSCALPQPGLGVVPPRPLPHIAGAKDRFCLSASWLGLLWAQLCPPAPSTLSAGLPRAPSSPRLPQSSACSASLSCLTQRPCLGAASPALTSSLRAALGLNVRPESRSGVEVGSGTHVSWGLSWDSGPSSITTSPGEASRAGIPCLSQRHCPHSAHLDSLGTAWG